jgi:predicted metal-binding membrane protein
MMSAEAASKAAFIAQLFPFIAIIVSIAIGGWVLTTWMRIKNGYPLDGAWGQAIYPKKNDEAMERIRLLSSENAQLRAELGSVKDRLATVERIVTDDSHRLTEEIEALRLPKN